MEIQQLKDMGFGAAEAEVALSQAGNVEQALELLLTTETDSPAPPSPTRTAAGTSGTVLVAPGAADGPVETEWPELPKKKMKPPGLEDQGYNADVSRSNEFALEDIVWGLMHHISKTSDRIFMVLVDSCCLVQSMIKEQTNGEMSWVVSRTQDNVPTPQMPRPLGLPCGLLNVGNTCSSAHIRG